MADLSRKFRGIVENSWTHLVALIFLQLGNVYQFFYGIGKFTYLGGVKTLQWARQWPRLLRAFDFLLKSLYHVGLYTFGFGYSLLKRSLYFWLDFTKGFLIKLLSGDMKQVWNFVKLKTTEVCEHILGAVDQGLSSFADLVRDTVQAAGLFENLTNHFNENTLLSFIVATMTRLYGLVVLSSVIWLVVYVDFITVRSIVLCGLVFLCVLSVHLCVKLTRKRKRSSGGVQVSIDQDSS